MKTLKNLIPILSIFLFFSSCNDNDSINFHEINPYVADWDNFNEGSYWIYSNDISEELEDTIKIIIDFGKGQGGTYVKSIDKTLERGDYYEWTEAYFGSPERENNTRQINGHIQVTGIGIIAWNENYYDLNIEDVNIIFRINDKGIINEEIEYSNHKYTIESISQLDVLSKTYTEIAHVTIKPNDSDNEYQYWISKDNWVIKKSLQLKDKTYSWSLKESIIKK
jgi:hypothetical protein